MVLVTHGMYQEAEGGAGCELRGDQSPGLHGRHQVGLLIVSLTNQRLGNFNLTNRRPGLEIITGAESVKLMSELAEVSLVMVSHQESLVYYNIQVSSILQMRVLEVMVLITQLSGDHLKAVERTGFLAQLVSLLQTQVILTNQRPLPRSRDLV